MDFSVLLSVYFREQPLFLQECLNSILSQTVPPTEIVLVKDGCLTKELDLIIKDFQCKNPMLKVIPLPVNQGLGKALNIGLQHCSYNLVARMDTDDIAKPDRFEKQLAIFEKYPYLDVVGAWIDEFEGTTSHPISIRKVVEKHEQIYVYAKSRCPVNHPVVMFRRKAVLNAGGYLHFPLFEDYYLWVRMLINGSKFYNIQESLLYFRFSKDMFKRRGGWKYAIDEFQFQCMLRKIGFISGMEFVKNVTARFGIRVLPNFLRELIYKNILR